jgi:hypothetical protein
LSISFLVKGTRLKEVERPGKESGICIRLFARPKIAFSGNVELRAPVSEDEGSTIEVIKLFSYCMSEQRQRMSS